MQLHTKSVDECISPLDLVPEEGAVYGMVKGGPAAHVMDLKGWQQNVCSGQEAAATQRAIQELTDRGYTNITQYCGDRQTRDPAGQKLLEFDSLALASEAFCIVESKTTLTPKALQSLISKLTKIRLLLQDNTTIFGSLRDKCMIAAVSALYIRQTDAFIVKRMLKEEGIILWLPNGMELSEETAASKQTIVPCVLYLLDQMVPQTPQQWLAKRMRKQTRPKICQLRLRLERFGPVVSVVVQSQFT